MSESEKVLREQDKKKRLAEEAQILEKAKRLTNGESTNTKLQGEVQFWIVGKLIGLEALIRTAIKDLENKREIVDCDMIRMTAKSNCPARSKPEAQVTGKAGMFRFDWNNKHIYAPAIVVIAAMVCYTLMVITGHATFPFFGVTP